MSFGVYLKMSITKLFKISDKQYRIPLPVTKVQQLSNGDAYPLCPRCGTLLPREYMCFCDCCGQMLDWKDFSYTSAL